MNRSQNTLSTFSPCLSADHLWSDHLRRVSRQGENSFTEIIKSRRLTHSLHSFGQVFMHQKYDVDPQGEIKFQISDTDRRIILKITEPHVLGHLICHIEPTMNWQVQCFLSYLQLCLSLLEFCFIIRYLEIGLTFSFTPAATVCPRRSSLPFPCQVTSAVSSPVLPKITQAWSSDSARWTSFRLRTWQAATTANATPELSNFVPGWNGKIKWLFSSI